MYFPEEKLLQRQEIVAPAENETVWHLCHSDIHLKICNDLARVTREIPEIPEGNLDGMFLMRLHPRQASIEEKGGNLLLRMVAATSYPHSTVWSFRSE